MTPTDLSKAFNTNPPPTTPTEVDGLQINNPKQFVETSLRQLRSGKLSQAYREAIISRLKKILKL